MTTLSERRTEIEALQESYRRAASLNTGVIRGGLDTQALGEKIIVLQSEYNLVAKTSMYSGGKCVKR